MNLILDLVGYDVSKPLYRQTLIEPSAGDGSFLKGIALRLIESCRRANVPLTGCQSSVYAFEISEESARQARESLRALLVANGVSVQDAKSLAASWVHTGDYLLESAGLAGKADYVVGNPPYIRLENMVNGGELYRASYPTMVGRADIYVAFFEASLRQLKRGGMCGFICADRWMFNQYGASLRSFITSSFSVDAVIQMHHADAFETEVSAYPAVTIIRNASQGPVIVATLSPDDEHIGAEALASEFAKNGTGAQHTNAARIERWFTGSAPWPLMEPLRLALLRRLESEFSTLEETGASVGIGVATGADKVFITTDPDVVETERLLPLAMASDVRNGGVFWSGHYLVNPWKEGHLVDLNEYPRLRAYLQQNRTQLSLRHVGKKSPANWYRTIDRVTEDLVRRPKLYLPDFGDRIAPVLDSGGTYPHHNVYYVVPAQWDPEALGGLLLSDVAQFFVEAYGVRMRGGYLRFQAQYIRRIRVPEPSSITADQMTRLAVAFGSRDVCLANVVCRELYRLSPVESDLISHTSKVP